MNNTALGAVSNKKENFRFISEAHEYKMSRPNVQKILYKNVQLVCLS